MANGKWFWEGYLMNSSVTTRTYVAGYILSIILTLTAFKVVDDDLLKGWGFTLTLVAFAVVQLFVQLLFFLHLDKERKPRLNLMAFAFMAMVLLIIVLGSLWIMDNLNYHVMTDEEIIQDEGLDY
jgi:cytochrome o ubiquinol oxidase operon protein cyoD